MRGLDERIAYAQAKIGMMFMPEGSPAEEDLSVIFHDAMGQGIDDYRSGKYDIPIMYQGIQLLVRGWVDGQIFAAESEEMANCDGCNDPNLLWCPVHG